MNEANLMGNVGADPEIKETKGGKKFASFSLATSERWTDKATGEKKEVTTWHRCIVWNENLVPVVEQYVRKGSQLFVRGQITIREWHKEGTPQDDRRWQTEITLNGFSAVLRLLGKAGNGSNRAPDPEEPKRDYARPPANGNGSAPSRSFDRTMDDEIPFAPEVR